jgi:predicted peptidase
MKKIFALAVFLVFLSGCAAKRPGGDEFLKREVTVGTGTYGYRVFVPRKSPPGEKLPILLYLHGAGARGEANESQVLGLSESVTSQPDKIPFLIVAPQCRPSTFWGASETAEQTFAALDKAIQEFNGDSERIYIAGYSMGASGAWQFASAYPDKFAALILISGSAPDRISQNEKDLMLSEATSVIESPDPYAAWAEKLHKTPVWIFHGSADDTNTVEDTRKMVDALKTAGNTNVQYTEFPDGGHIIAVRALSQPGLFDWMLQQAKQKNQ